MVIKIDKPEGAADSSCVVVEFLLDETGSMQNIKPQTISGYNSFLTEQKAIGGQCLLTLTKFDTRGLRTPYVDLDMAFVPMMTANMFDPTSGTNLRDAIGARVEALDARLKTWTIKPRVAIFVMTDGHDNASVRFSENDIARLIKNHPDYSFHYFGSTSDALSTARRLGFNQENSRYFDVSRIEDAMREVSTATVALRATF